MNKFFLLNTRSRVHTTSVLFEVLQSYLSFKKLKDKREMKRKLILNFLLQIIEPHGGDGEDGEMDDLPLWLDVNEDPSNDYFVENLWHHPNQLSEEMVQCMRDIFLFLADSSKLSSSEGVASPRGHLSYSSLASFSDSSILASLVRSPSVDLHNVSEIFARDGMFDPYSIPGKVDWTRSIGTYSMAAEVSWMSVGKKQLEYAAGAFKRFRFTT